MTRDGGALPTLPGPIPTSRIGVPSEHVFTGLALAAVLFCVGAGVVIGRYQGAVTINHTRTVNRSIGQQYGKPTETIDGTQINQNLAGFTCDIYQAKATIVCHRP